MHYVSFKLAQCVSNEPPSEQVVMCVISIGPIFAVNAVLSCHNGRDIRSYRMNQDIVRVLTRYHHVASSDRSTLIDKDSEHLMTKDCPSRRYSVT